MKFSNIKIRLVKKESLTLVLLSTLFFSFSLYLPQISLIQEVKAQTDDLLLKTKGSLYTIENSYIRIRHDVSTGFTDIYRLDAGILAINNIHPKINYNGTNYNIGNVATTVNTTRCANSLILNTTYIYKDNSIDLLFNLTTHRRFFIVKAVYKNLNQTHIKTVEILSPIMSDGAKPAGEIERTLLYRPKVSLWPAVTNQDFTWINGSEVRSFSLIGLASNLPVMLMMNPIDKLIFLATAITDTVWTPYLALERSSPDYGFSSLQLSCYSHVDLKIPIIVNPNGKIETEAFLVGFYEDINDAIASYKAALLEFNYFPSQQRYLMFGTWRTWSHGPDVSEANLKALADYLNQTWLPYHSNVLLQIDDGWQKNAGDWEPDPIKFPNGLEPLISYIRSKGLKAGIWLALYVVDDTSRLYTEHPDWLLRDTYGQLIPGGVEQYFLDPTNPNVQRWIKATLQKLYAMGFILFKIDHWAGFDAISEKIDFFQKNTTLVEARNIMLQIAYDALKHDPDVIIQQTFCRNPLTLRFAHTIYLYDFPTYPQYEDAFRLMLRGTFESLFSPTPHATKFFDYVLTNRYGSLILSDSHIRLMLASEFVSGGIVTLGGEMITNMTRIQMLGSLIPAFAPQSVKHINISNDTQMYEVNYQRDSLSWKYLVLLNLNITEAKSFSSILEREYLAYEIFTQKNIGLAQNIDLKVPPLDARVVVLVPPGEPTILTTSRHILNIPELMPSINFTPPRLTATLQIPAGATATIYSPYAHRSTIIDGNPRTLKMVSKNLYEFKAQSSERIELIEVPMKITYLTGPSVTLRYGDSSIITTRLIDEELNAIPGCNVNFYLNYMGSWYKIGSGITNSTGYTSMIYVANLMPNEYKLRVEFSGNLTPNAYYGPKVNEGYLKVNRGKLEVDISVSMPIIYVGEKTTITLTVTSSRNKIPYLYTRIYAEEGLIGAAYTDQNGTVRVYWNPRSAGMYTLKAEVEGGAFYESYLETTSLSVEWSPLLIGLFTSVPLILLVGTIIIFLKKKHNR